MILSSVCWSVIAFCGGPVVLCWRSDNRIIIILGRHFRNSSWSWSKAVLGPYLLSLKLASLSNLWSRFHVTETTCHYTPIPDTGYTTAGLHSFSKIRKTRISIPYSKLCHCAHFACDPASQDLASLLLTKSGSREVSLVNKCDNVNYDLVLIENCVYYDGYDGSKVGFSSHFNKHYYEPTSLEYSTTNVNPISVIR